MQDVGRGDLPYGSNSGAGKKVVMRIHHPHPQRLFFAAIGLFLLGAESALRIPQTGMRAADSLPGRNTPAGAGIRAVYIGTSDLDRFPPSGPFPIRFDVPMDSASSANPIMSFPYAEGSFAWSEDNSVLTFQPSPPLALGSTYTFFLDPALHAAAGDATDPVLQWTVRIEDGPTVVSVDPKTVGLEKRRPDAITLTFDRPMNRTSVERAFSIQPEIPFRLDWRDDRTLVVTPSEAFQPGGRYDLIVAGEDSDAPAEGADGIAASESFVWTYWLDPLTAAVTTTGRNTVEMSFNGPVDGVSSGTPFAITPALEGSWDWVDDRTVRFQSAEPIPLGQRFTIGVAGPLVNSFGPMQADPAEYPFSAVPPVRMGDVPEEAPVNFNDIAFYFSVPVDHRSAQAAFRMTPAVDGDFVWSQGVGDSVEIMTFHLNRLLDSGTDYSVQLLPSVKSSAGRPIMVDPLEGSFQTDPYYDWGFGPSFGMGSKVQVVDAAGTRKVQFSVPQNATVRFELFAYSLTEYVGLYAGRDDSFSYYERNDLLPLPGAGKSPAATWSYTDSAQEGEWINETAVPDDVKPGLYVMNMIYNGILYDQLFLVLTNNTLVVKLSGDELFVWLTDIGGASVAGAQVRLYSDTGREILQGTTDRNGVFRASVPEGVTPMLVAASHGEKNGFDVTVSGVDSQFRTVSAGGGNSSRAGADGRYRIYVYTERPMYRPGQAVFFKAVVRRDTDVKYSLPPAGTPVTVNIRDSRKSLVQTLMLQTDDFGCVEGSFTLGVDAVLGDYTIEAAVDGGSQTQIFGVEDYRKPDYSVAIQPINPAQAESVVAGDTVEFTVDVEYYFGEPAANAKVNAAVYSLASYWGWSYAEDRWMETYAWYPPYSVSVRASPVTDSNGKARVTLEVGELSEYESRQSWRNSAVSAMYALQVTVDDGSSQTVSATYLLTAYSASEIIDVANGGCIQRPGQSFIVRAGAQNLSGDPVGGRSLTLAVKQWDRGQREYGILDSYSLTTDSYGRAQQELSLDSGYYVLELTGRDAEGREMTDDTWVAVFSTPDDWFSRIEQEVDILPDQDSYAPNQTARFMIESTFSGPALLTFERGRVLSSMPVELTAPLTVVEAKILPEFAPNVFVTVNAWQPSTFAESDDCDYGYYGSNRPDSHLRLASAEIRVDAGSRELQVGISTDREVYAPGQSMRVTVGVTDAEGKPAAAEVSLAVVDESIFALRDEQSPDIFSAFYGERRRSVRTYDSMSPDRIIVPGGQGGGGGGDLVPTSLRSSFNDTAAWYPSLKTDAGGHLTVTVQLPDNLTTWRLTARAVTRSSLVGQAVAHVTMKKELIVRPILPKILTTGDQVELVTYIHNYGEAARDVTVTFAADGLELSGRSSRQITVQPGEALPLTWQAIVDGVTDGSVTVRAAASDGLEDSVRLPLSIQPAATTSVYNQSGEFTGNLRVVLPLPQIVPETSRVTLQLSRTMSGTILGGLEYLTGYPYGCVEQMMSKALPNAVVGRAQALLGLGDPGMAARLDPLIRTGIQRLLNYQHPDGGWGWWYDDASTPYQTAWVLFGLAQVSDAGYAIPGPAVGEAVKYLEWQLDTMDVRTRAFALYSMALAGRGNLESALALTNSSLRRMDPFSRAALALALQEMGDAQTARTVLAEIGREARRTRTLVYWPQENSDGEYRRKTMSSTLRTTALILDAYVAIDPTNPLVPGIAKYLIAKRQGRNGWGTTNETAFTILALTDYLVSQQQKSGGGSFRVELNGEALAEGILQAGKNTAAIDLPLGRMDPGVNILTVTSSGSREVYYDLSAQYSIRSVPMEPSGMISVERRYLFPSSGIPVTTMPVGQLVKVELTVDLGEDASYFMVEDHLPGGLEALNEHLNTTPSYSPPSDYGSGDPEFFWEDLGYNYKEIRGGRVSFFITDLRKGKHVFTYLARAVSGGTFLALPAQAYAMYDLRLWGRSAGAYVYVLS